MTIAEIFELLKKSMPQAELVLEETRPDPVIRIAPAALAEAAILLRDTAELSFDCLMCLSGLETAEELLAVYHLYSMKHGHKVSLKCGSTKEEEVVIPTVCRVWPTAEWHEREAWDLFGLRFADHPDHRRILCPDDWEGFPLRKDYVPQNEWQGIPLANLLPDEAGNGDEV